MKCMCIKKDGLQCTFNAKGTSKYCGRHQACANDVSTARGFTIKRKSAAKPTAVQKSALKTVKRFPVTKVKEYLRVALPKANLDKLTLVQLRRRVEDSLGVDLSTPEFKPRFKQLVIDTMR